MKRRWEIPQGLRVCPDGSWRVGEYHVIHPPSLRYFKSHLITENGGAYIVDGTQRMPVDVEGPAFRVVTLVLDADKEEARAVLDDGSVEPLTDGALGMNRESGQFECRVREGRFRARLGRGPHQVLLQHMEEDAGGFFLRIGDRRIAVRT
ncbi:MAG TPA: hypothetical protein VFO85_16500 [Vicinamibacteria bacterium]|nr:hypothetical protein [Vicinamibacteria bacterium]